MISFLLCLAILIVGYFVYGKIVDNTFGPDDRETPAVRINDGVDYVVMPQWKLFLVQLLNIAGLGPIFGAMQGALWGPVVFLWITFGTIFAGGVHDYFSGMMSERNDGASIAEITGKYLGPVMQNVMRVFSVVLLIMVGTVFAVGPAGLIVELCHQSGASGVLTSLLFWLIIILVYYFIATFISIDAVIGKIYPIFGICLIIMAIGVIFGIFTNPAYTIPEIWDHFGSMHPSSTPIWSFMFITVACGAISGFHSTQSPLMARCPPLMYRFLSFCCCCSAMGLSCCFQPGMQSRSTAAAMPTPTSARSCCLRRWGWRPCTRPVWWTTISGTGWPGRCWPCRWRC